MVAMIFMVVLVVALAFYFKFQLASLEESGEDVCFVSNTVLLSSISGMAEIQCSVNGNRERCIDTTKVLVFDPGDAYGDLFSANCDQKVYFVQEYPLWEEDEDVVCEQNNYPDCNIFEFYDPGVTYSSSVLISTPTALYYPIDGSYTLGRLTVEVLL
jgi:hypothetical protein